MDKIEKEIFDKLSKSEELTEKEIDFLVYETKQVDEVEGDDHRWDREMKTILELNGKFFAVDWRKGLTENQENSFYNQPYEVTKNEYQKTITICEWMPVKEQ